MRKKLLKKRNLSQTEIVPDFLNFIKKEEEVLLYKLISSIKSDKISSKNLRDNYHKSKSMNNKSIKINNLKSCINLSKENKNFCGSFLYPDYKFVSGKKILKDLKSNGAEKTISKYYNKHKNIYQY